MAEKWKNELLLETLRSKSSKSFIELAKNTRLNLLERRYNIDAVEKQTLQTALDNLQNNIQIKSRSHFVEKLESITRRSLLKFTDNANTSSLFISSDMFYLEILLDPQSGKVNDVKVHHECSNSESDPHLVDVLRKGDFIDFTQHLEGFQSIYQLNAESKIKSKAFIAIQALESDIANIFNYESMTNAPPEALVLASSTGLVTKRRGGHPMKLLFFVRPSELLNFEKKRMDPLTSALQAAAAAKKSIGNSVTINLEAAAPSNKLQTAPLLVKNTKPEGGFTYNQINLHNSTMLPAVFVLRFNHGMPMNQQVIEEIKKITNNLGVFGDQPVAFKTENILAHEEPKTLFTSLINLIISFESEGSYENGQKGLFVTLADQSHCYFVSDNNDMTGTITKTIQFTEPSHITQIIKLIRQQALFNALIASCVRKQNARQDFDCYMIEVNVVTLQFIQIFVQHPFKESMVTVELDLSDIMHLTCKIHVSDQKLDSKLDNYITRVFQKTMSIPMVLRSLIKCWDKEAQDLQQTEKRLSNNELFGSDSKKDSKGNNNDGEKKDSSGKTNDDFAGGRIDTSGVYDICGINKNEIFLKTSDPMLDLINQQKPSSHVMSFDLDDDLVLPSRSEDKTESSMSPASNMSEGSRKGLMFSSKAGTPTQKLMDVFDFNDPSPPPVTTTLLPMQSPVGEARKIPTPRASPSAASLDKRPRDLEILPIKSPIDASIMGHSSLSITPVGSTPEFIYEKPKSEKKKKRKREDGDSSPALTKKKSSDSLGSSPSKKSSSQLMGKPSSSFKPKKSPLPVGAVDDLAFLNYEQQAAGLPSPMRSPKNQSKGSTQSQNNRKHSLSAVINKLKSEMTDTAPGGEDNKSEYQIKSSGSDGIKITFNKTKMSKGMKGSPKHTGLKPGVNSGPASKKSSQSSKSSQKLLYSKSSSSSSLEASNSAHLSFKSSSQPGKSSSSKDRSSDLNQFPSFSGSSNDMLKNMLNLASPVPRSDIMKAFDRKFQIPKLSARGKTDEKPAVVEDTSAFNSIHPRSAPSTPIQYSTPSPTIDFMRDGSSSGSSTMAQQKFLPTPPNKFHDHNNSQSNKKLFKSVSSEQLFGEAIPKFNNDARGNSTDISDIDFQAFLKSQSRKPEPSASVSMHLMKSPMHQLGMDGNMNQAGEANAFNDNDLIDLNFGNEL